MNTRKSSASPCLWCKQTSRHLVRNGGIVVRNNFIVLSSNGIGVAVMRPRYFIRKDLGTMFVSISPDITKVLFFMNNQLFLAISSVLIASMWFQIAELSKLAKIAFGCCGVEAEVTDYLFCSEFVLIGHKFQNIDQFLCQRWLYRPFIDHFLLQILFIDQFLRR